MRTHRPYPLTALEEHRRRLVEEARGSLADAVGEVAKARSAFEEADRGHCGAVTRLRAAEGRTAGGLLADLQGAGRWLGGLRREERRLGAERARLKEEADRAAAVEERRRELLIEVERQHRVVERHRELWEESRRGAERRAEEAEQEEQVSARGAQRWR